MVPSPRLVAIATVLTLCAGNLVVCAGWRTTPEARMACCQDESMCPMHKSVAHGSATRHQLTQAQADTCCAATSNRTHSSVASPTFVVSNPIALPAPADAVLQRPVLALQEWRATAPLRVSPVPKHLLLSVLLI